MDSGADLALAGHSKAATILFGTVFRTVISTYSSVDNVDRNLILMGQSFGLSWLPIAREIILPGVMPPFFQASVSRRRLRSCCSSRPK